MKRCMFAYCVFSLKRYYNPGRDELNFLHKKVHCTLEVEKALKTQEEIMVASWYGSEGSKGLYMPGRVFPSSYAGGFL